MDSDSSRRRVDDLFLLALEVPADRREAWLLARCGADENAFRETMTLLRAHSRMADGFLEAPALDFRGRTFGPYRATQPIGRGGMSVVYRGERADGGFHKQVAIKIALAQTTALQRGETQILAGLEHPNIARLIDAGVSDLGFPYLLMEYVEGQTIATYAANLPEERRLRLFLQVCAGVHSAHQSLVVHRDLKPDNVLVTADGTVKLLDFGIAKALTPDFTGPQTTGIKAFTADYASPEQILGKPVTTAADIYSLGVLLCAICGRRPPRTFAGLDLGEVVQRAQAEEVNDIPLRDDLALIAAKALRREPRERYESASAMARDIERYLAREPIEARAPSLAYLASRFVSRHRYAVPAAAAAAIALAVTAGVALRQAQLARARFDDVRGLAKSVMFELHDAVAPLPGSLEARKLIVDRSLAYLDKLGSDKNAGADVQMDVARGYLRLAEVLGRQIGGGGLGHPRQAVERGLQAVAAARRAVDTGGGSLPARLLLIDALGAASETFEMLEEPEKGVPLALEGLRVARGLPAAPKHHEALALILRRLATLQFLTKDKEAAFGNHRESLAIRQRLHDADPSNPERKYRLAEANHHLGVAYFLANEMPSAEKYLREAMRIDQERYLANPDTAREDLASDAVQLSQAMSRQKDYQAALQLLERTVALRREIAAIQPKSMDAALRVASALDRLGWTYQALNRYPEAVRAGEQALEQVRAIIKTDESNALARREIFYSLVDLSSAHQRGRIDPARACSLAREALLLAASRPGLPPGHRKIAAGIVAKCPQ